jgi:hypothetical protein
MSNKNDLLGTIINLGNVIADVTKNKDGSYTTFLMDNSGSRQEFAKLVTGNKSMLTEVLSWFAKM